MDCSNSSMKKFIELKKQVNHINNELKLLSKRVSLKDSEMIYEEYLKVKKKVLLNKMNGIESRIILYKYPKMSRKINENDVKFLI